MKQSPKTNKQRQAEFHEKMRAGGFVRRTVWVPAEDRARFDAYVARMRKAKEGRT